VSAVTINNVYPWGRSFDEYRRMFALTDCDLARHILGCADGPAAFNAAMHRLGRRAISCDPLYQFPRDEIRARIDATYPHMLEFATRERNRFVWTTIPSPERLGQIRMAAMNDFLADYQSSVSPTRYFAGALPDLPFADQSFDLALCSHFLFLYSNDLCLDFHRRSVLELCRVAPEVRIFPLLDMDGRPSPHVAPLLHDLPRHDLRATIERVDYEFQRGGDEMLRLTRTA
jgi:hypothetical protein